MDLRSKLNKNVKVDKKYNIIISKKGIDLDSLIIVEPVIKSKNIEQKINELDKTINYIISGFDFKKGDISYNTLIIKRLIDVDTEVNIIINKKDIIAGNANLEKNKFIQNKRSRSSNAKENKENAKITNKNKQNSHLKYNSVELGADNNIIIPKNILKENKLKNSSVVITEDYNRLEINKDILTMEMNEKIKNYSFSTRNIISSSKTYIKQNKPNSNNFFHKTKIFDDKILDFNLINQLNNIKLSASNNIKINLEEEENTNTSLNKLTTSKLSNENKEDVPMINYKYKYKQGRQPSIDIYQNDFHKLDDDNYLNDNIILFYLK